MSAYVVGKPHIDALVRALREYEPGANLSRWQVETLDDLGRMLWEENVKSVSYRYRTDDPTELPGPNGGVTPATYEYEPLKAKHLSPVETLKAIDGYTYQSCEHPTWETSQAHRFCEYLRSCATHKLPGYDAADWEVPEAPKGQSVSLLDMFQQGDRERARIKKAAAAAAKRGGK